MRKRRVYVVVIGVWVLVGLMIWGLRRERQPEYGGKRLSEWVMNYAGTGTSQQAEAENAVRHVGSNAVPYLLNWISYDTPPWKRNLYRILTPAVRRLHASCQSADEKPNVRALGAMQALLTLKPIPEGAIRELSRLANGTNPKNSRIEAHAVCVLDGLGPPGLLALVGILANQQAHEGKWTRAHARIARYIGQDVWMDRNTARAAVPALLHMLKDPDPEIRDAAKDALEAINPQAREGAAP